MINIITVKIGTKYNSTYVNRVFDMCNKHITYPFTFLCYTDDKEGLNPNVQVIPFIDNKLKPIVHNKLFLFSKEIEDQICSSFPRLFFDIDIVIKDNIDKLCEHAFFTTEPLGVINASWKQHTKKEIENVNLHQINSSCMIWKPYANVNIWKKYVSDKQYYMSKYDKGMDAYLVHEHNIKGTLPENLFRSYIFGIPTKYLRPITAFNHYKRVQDSFPIVLFNGPCTEEDVISFINSNYQTFFFDMSLVFTSDKEKNKQAAKEAELLLNERMSSVK
jgi:hypothetical protein